MPLNTPLITFVVQCYNTEQYVAECVRSIIDQGDAFAWEMIVVDDCSTDKTAEVLLSFSDPRIRVISHTVNVGPQESINEAMNSARGQFIARIDSDDRYRSNFLSNLVPVFAHHRDVGMAYGDAAIMDCSGQLVASRCNHCHVGNTKGNDFLGLLQRNFICAPTMMARREAWLKCLPIPNHIALADWYCNVLIAREYETYYVDDVLADYRVHPGNLHSQIVADGRDEASVVWLLDHIFSSKEPNPQMERQKQRARGRIYSAQYKTLADKYFGIGMNSAARRCYHNVFRHAPWCVLSPPLVRRFAATFIRRAWYDDGKRVWRQLTRAVV